MERYQLVIIGAGPGGYEAAIRARELGMKTALIEKRDIGGTCLNRGCIPAKTLLHAADRIEAVREAAAYGICADTGSIDLKSIFTRKEEVSRQLREGLEGLLTDIGTDIIRGTGTICGTGRVKVVSEQETRELEGEHILIASGSVPARPPIPGLETDGVMTSDEILDGAEKVYDSLIIIGGGVIGIELAFFYQSLGCRVIILEGMDRLLPGMDKEIGQNMASILKKAGVSIYTKARVMEIGTSGKEPEVKFMQKDKLQSVTGEKVLCAVGRTPDLEKLLEPGNELDMEGRFIKVNDRFETSIPGVYAIGDVSSRIQLAHMAAAQGRVCVEMIAGQKPSVNLNAVPGCVYSTPEAASVGLTEEEAKKAGIEAVSGKYVMFSNGRTLIGNVPRSFIKLVAEKESHCIIGAQLMCASATDMISEFTEAINHRLTAEELSAVLRPHPTFEEGAGEALRALMKKL